jgi:uncharacterized protein YecE (DUF72 family)
MALDPLARDHYPADRAETARSLAQRSPLPARVGNVRFGSASWTDPTLVRSGLFYPRGASTAEKRLRYYASRFSMVEVDASYYALPTVAQARSWVERTPDDFRFNIKAFSAMTGHPVELRALPKELAGGLPGRMKARKKARVAELPEELVEACWQRFLAAAEPLSEAGKLGAVLLQFPPWFTATRGNARRIVECRTRLGDLPGAVEFRHRSWLDDSRWARVQDLLRDQGMTYVAVDAPRGFETALPPWRAVTNPRLAMVRFHGRNRATWEGGGSTAAERFDHLYTPEELGEWVDGVRELSDQAEEVHVVMNNCTYDAAQLGGYGIAALLREATALLGASGEGTGPPAPP